jgi:hypothetical protein
MIIFLINNVIIIIINNKYSIIDYFDHDYFPPLLYSYLN